LSAIHLVAYTGILPPALVSLPPATLLAALIPDSGSNWWACLVHANWQLMCTASKWSAVPKFPVLSFLCNGAMVQWWAMLI